MTRFRARATAVWIAAMLAAAGPARADIAPAELWSLWQRQAEARGMSLNAGVRPEAGGVVLDAPRLSLPWQDGRLSLSAERGRLRPDGAGGSALVLDPGQVLDLRLDGGAEGPVAARITLGGDGVRLGASGEAAAPVYTFASPQLILSLLEATRDGVPLPAAEALVTLDGLSGEVTPGAPTVFSASAETATTRYAIGETGTAAAAAGSTGMTGLRLDGRLTPPVSGVARWRADLTLESDAGTATSRQTLPDRGVTESDLRSGPSRLSLAVLPDRLDYAASAAGLALTLRGAGLPVAAAEIGMETAALSVSLPLPGGAPDGDAGTLGLGLVLSGVTAGEPLWALVDPVGALPRSAADLSLRAEAGLTAIAPATREAFAAGDSPELPALLPRSLTIHEFSLDFADMALQADGAFTTETAAGGALPDLARPVGQLDVSMTGAMALLQRLTAAGLVSTEMSLGAQMMIGMFTTQGDGDSLTSTIRTDAGGGLVINGTRLR